MQLTRLLACTTALLLALPTSAAEPKPPLVRELKEFGDTSGKALRDTYEKAIAELRKTGGVLEVPAASIGEDSSTDTVPGWDSLRHMNLILALEEEFSVTIPDDEAGNLTSYPLIRLVIAELLEAAGR